jgi:geranylgeranyl pyrophosphate synthase
MQPPFETRLCHSLVADVLGEVEQQLATIKMVRFLADYPWPRGKRLRPMTFLLANFSIRVERSWNVSVNGRESRLATAIELLHEASLVHDDLVDRSDLRRGVPSVQMVKGDGLALLIGDYMVFRGLKLILDSATTGEDIALAQELANTGLEIAHGEADQLARYLLPLSADERMSMDNYLDVIAKKTAVFFAGCAEAGAALAKAPRALRRCYREFGMNLGLLFQMTDDLIDIAGDPRAAKKPLRCNVSEGTVTLPMIHAWRLRPDHPALRAFAEQRPLTPAEERTLYRLLAGDDVMALSRQTMKPYREAAAAAVSQMPNNIYRQGLADLLSYVDECSWGRIGSSKSSEGRNGRSRKPRRRTPAVRGP